MEYPFGKKYEDIATTYKLFDKSNCIVYIPETYYYYTQRKGSILSNKSQQLLEQRMKITYERIKFLQNRKYNTEEILKSRINDTIFYHIQASKYKYKDFSKSSNCSNEK